MECPFSRNDREGLLSHNLFEHIRVIVRTSLVVIGVKHCIQLPRLFSNIIINIINDKT